MARDCYRVPFYARLTTPVHRSTRSQILFTDPVHSSPHPFASARTQILSVLLDPLYPGFAENCIFVAGDRVTTDLLAQVIASDCIRLPLIASDGL